MLSPDALTDEQRAVVRHGAGPAVVLAVPGAGKTTTLVHRIRHLVDERDVAPARLLACSFNRGTVQDLVTTLAALDIQGVDVRTLHSLGYALRQRANSSPPPSTDHPDGMAYDLARQSLQALAAKQNQNWADLGISPTDLVDQIASWKQQLAYPDLDAADLSAEAREIAQQAEHENEDYLTLYHHFETRRRQNGALTYPDMLRDGWEALMHSETLRSDAQQAHDYVMVDEFQDVSRAQFQILDVLTAPDRNYLVVGDDDQCIYGWRGASPSFLRSFADRYDAATYRMESSFRLPAAPLVLANAVIQHNEARRSKQIRLVCGFGGDAHLIEAEDPHAEAIRLADTIRQLQTEERYSLDDVAILVRTYGQTPPLEQVLLDRDLPYDLHGHAPFYRRREIQTLLRYLFWAVLDRRRRSNGWFENARQAEQYVERFSQIVNAPNRYVARGRLDRITQEALNQRESVLDVTARHLSEMHNRTAERVEPFLETADQFVDRLDNSADATLEWLVETIDYETALREQSASPNRGEARIQTVRALIRYAASHDTARSLLNDVQSMAAEEPHSDKSTPALDIRSIHRAKGLEWPVVFVPGCTEGTLPLGRDGSTGSDVAEERRLFYVAVTRTQEQLYLSTNAPDSPSRFLEEAEVDTRLPLARTLRTALTDNPAGLTDELVAQLCRGVIELDLESYVRHEWSPGTARAQALRSRLDDFSFAITESREQYTAYRRAQAQHEQEKDGARAAVQDRVRELRDAIGNTTFAATHEQPETFYPEDARFRFEWTSEKSEIAVYWNGARVAVLNPLGIDHLVTQTVMALPWNQLAGRFAGVGRSRQQLRFSIDWAATEAQWSAAEVDSLSSPDPPSERTRLLAHESVQTGCDLLRECLAASGRE